MWPRFANWRIEAERVINIYEHLQSFLPSDTVYTFVFYGIDRTNRPFLEERLFGKCEELLSLDEIPSICSKIYVHSHFNEGLNIKGNLSTDHKVEGSSKAPKESIEQTEILVPELCGCGRAVDDKNTIFYSDDCKKHISIGSLRKLCKENDIVIGFNLNSREIKRENLEIDNLLRVGEYEDDPSLFMVDFRNKNKINGTIKIKDADEFYCLLDGDKRASFRIDYVRALLGDQPYYFCYLHKKSVELYGHALLYGLRHIVLLEEYKKSKIDTHDDSHTTEEYKDTRNMNCKENKVCGKFTNNTIRVLLNEENLEALLPSLSPLIDAQSNLAFKENTVTFKIKGKEKYISLESYKILGREEFECVLLGSEELAICTGDMSLTQVISSGRIAFYQALIHKLHFIRDVLILKNATSDNNLKSSSPKNNKQCNFREDWSDLLPYVENSLVLKNYRFIDKFTDAWFERYQEFLKYKQEENFQKKFYKKFMEMLTKNYSCS
ncbi:hypothetical protein ENBRE01_0087 [Enteropsectra breve]|nr:hypothetical protein ENBRE01_0087 [Enteropsectra breve]